MGSQLFQGNLVEFDILDTYKKRWQTYWFGLDGFSRLPDDLVLATTEIGLPAAMNPRKTIVDLSGLNETAFAHHGFSADHLFQTYCPDLIYLPHPHYTRIIEQIINSPFFIQYYEHFPALELGTEMGVALWRGSRYYPEMRAVLDRGASGSRVQ